MTTRSRARRPVKLPFSIAATKFWAEEPSKRAAALEIEEVLTGPGKIRLPDLVIFRRFSLALRQEFSEPEDILDALKQTFSQVQAAAGMPPDESFQGEGTEGVQDFASRFSAGASLRSSPGGSGDRFAADQSSSVEPLRAAAGSEPDATSPFPDALAGSDEDPKSYLKRLAQRPAFDEAEDLASDKRPIQVSFSPPDETGPPESDAPPGKPTSPQDEERFWGRAKRRPKKPRGR